MSEPAVAVQKDKPFFLARHRVEALADAIFGIAMTLLVLELKVPELVERTTDPRTLMHALASEWKVFFSFGVTFVLAAVFWIMQQRIFKLIHGLDRTSTFLSMATMLFVSLLPFSTATVGRYSHNAAALILYFGNQFAIALSISLLWFRAAQTGSIEPADYAEHTLLGWRVIPLTTACLVASLTALVNPEYSWTAFIVVVLILRLYRKIDLRRKN